MRTKTILAISLTLCVIVSCKKDNRPTLIEGTVFEYGSNKPIAGATIILGSQEKGVVGGSYRTDRSTTSDINGRYSFSPTLIRIGIILLLHVNSPNTPRIVNMGVSRMKR